MWRLRRRVWFPQRWLRLAAALAVLAVPDPSVPASAGEIDTEMIVHLLQGRRNYRIHCAPCHGLDGIAALTYAPGFRSGVAVLSDEYFLELMETGGLMMPPWGYVLTQEERVDIVSFVRHLSGGELAKQRSEHCHTQRTGETALPLVYPF